jgi:molybdopterin/thiamine biosynthesis adenylyltransferase
MSLNEEERATYEWQMWVTDFGEAGQERLKDARVLVSRCGGVGGLVALELAAAGVGTLVLAHGGNLRLDDLNRQVLMSHAGVGTPRTAQAERRLLDLNPRLRIVTLSENISRENVAELVGSVDVVASCAPLFDERLLMNQEAVRQGKPLVDCAMFDFEGQLTTVLPGRTACLRCLYPVDPPGWKRTFPVFGAVAGTIGCLGAVEVIKVLSGLGEPLAGYLLLCDLRRMSFRKIRVNRRADCPVCGH